MNADYLIRGGEVIDGTRTRARFPADVAIAQGRVIAMGRLDSVRARHTIEAAGKVVCPGFIDVHVHSENTLLGGRDQMAAAHQGVTTHLLGPDGFGWAGLPAEPAQQLWRYTQFAYGEPQALVDWPTIDSYLQLFPGRTPANVCPQIPHCAVRLAAMGWDARAATAQQLAAMERTTAQWLEAGARTLCLGLDYQPSANASFEELAALCRVVARAGGIYAAHLRYQILGRQDAWREIIRLHKETGIPVHVSHERVDAEVAGLLEEVDREDLDLTFESYLYPAGMTHLTMQLPMDVQAGSPEQVLQRMRDPAIRERSLRYLEERPTRTFVIGYTRSGRYVGMSLAEAAAGEGKSPAEFSYDLVLEEDGIQAAVAFWPDTPREAQATLEATAPHPRMMIGSDGIYDHPHPHPRGYGCFAQFLGDYCRDRGLLSLEEAVWKVSGFPAQRYRLTDRGRLAEGVPADLVVLDPQTVASRATFEQPLRLATGVEWVLVNGRPVIAAGAATAERPGEVLKAG